MLAIFVLKYWAHTYPKNDKRTTHFFAWIRHLQSSRITIYMNNFKMRCTNLNITSGLRWKQFEVVVS